MSTLTLVHVVLSWIGILAGFVVVYGLFKGNRMDGWTFWNQSRVPNREPVILKSGVFGGLRMQ